MLEIYVDADACPVKEEIYKVAERHDVPILLVANQWMRFPRDLPIRFIKVEDGADRADDYIAEQCHPHAIVITADILLAQRCIEKQAHVLAPTGKAFTESSIGNAVATRNLMADLREWGEVTGGPAPFSKQDRSRFLSSLHEAIVKLKRQ
ncbi:MAG: YaiI/YqxD family protein [Cohaesibacter sp.]|nr:YaiI/YqxD family protein [Cohaesibacter sp.]